VSCIVHHGDSLIADWGTYDILYTDPPYSAHVHKNAVSQSKRLGTRKRDLGFDHITSRIVEITARAAAGARRWALIYSDVESLAEWRTTCLSSGAQYIRPIPWIRWSMPQLSGDRPTTGCEFVSCFWGTQRGRKSWNGPGNLTHLAHKCLRGENKHKTEKPLDQALDLVEWFTNPGERVLDLFAGSGTIGLACKILGRSYLGYELDATWATYAQTRIDNWQTLSKRDQIRFDRWQSNRRGRVQADARA